MGADRPCLVYRHDKPRHVSWDDPAISIFVAHAHLGLLGWLSSIAFAFLYAVTDREGVSLKGPKAHCAAHNLGVATMATALFLTIKYGGGPISALIGIGGLIVVVSAISMAISLWPRLGLR